MKQIIDIEQWDRRRNYEFYQDFLNSWISVTGEVDCTEAHRQAKQAGQSFFVRYLYATIRAVNNVKELRYRKDSAGRICLYDRIDITTPVSVPGGTFFTVRIPYRDDYALFSAEAQRLLNNIPHDGDPYGVGKEISAKGDFDVVNLSATPKLHFTSITYTQFAPGRGQDYPLMNAGKAVWREGRFMMPFALTVDHAFVDGEHVARFFEQMQQTLDEAITG